MKIKLKNNYKLSTRLNIAIILSLFLHLIFINLARQDKIDYQVKSDLFNNKIALNFSFLEEKQVQKTNYSKKQLDKAKILQKAKTKPTNIKQELKKKSKNIPNITNYQLVGKKIIPNYPARSLKLGQEGIIYLKILVSDNGYPEEIIFTQKSQYDLLNQAALDAVSKWRFQPIIIDGNKSKMWINVPIEFKIS
jgi:TonB family protein